MTLREEEDLARELRRELIVLLHVTAKEYARLPDVDFLEALEGLREVRGSLISASAEHAALKVSVPPLLPSARLREVLRTGLRKALGRSVAVSIRLLPELADTVELARDLMEEWSEGGTGVLCFTDESAVGEPTRSLSELKEYLNSWVEDDILSAFPVNHYDVLCVVSGPARGLVSGPEKVISKAYGELSKVPVGSTARSLDFARELVEMFHR